jgi:iron complex transport system ATP-binding protein
MPSLFHFRDLVFGYTPAPVLRGISTEFDAGDFTAIVGPNGAGKSTLLKIMAGLLRDYSGQVEFAGRPVVQHTARDLAKRIAFVPQETRVVFPFTAGEIVMMGRLPHRSATIFDSRRDLERMHQAMTLTDTPALAPKHFHQLSGGERQRVVLAAALAQDPEVLLLDEPTVFLDLKHQIQFYGILERLNRERGMTIISVTHDLNLAARYARRIIALRSGMIAADGAPDAVLTPQHLYDIFEITAAVFRRPDGRGSYIVPTS